MRRWYYGPPDWLSRRFAARDRRAFAFWSFVAACAGTVPFGRSVLYVTILSVLALVSTFTSETPVEDEDGG
jgi:hypothetical protein